jgi:hypothetical protein
MWIGKTKFENRQATTLVELMRKKLAASGMGVTVQGSCVTLRFYEEKDGPLISVSMAIYDVDNGLPDPYDDEDK